jgi:hypothetical protein
MPGTFRWVAWTDGKPTASTSRPMADGFSAVERISEA